MDISSPTPFTGKDIRHDKIPYVAYYKMYPLDVASPHRTNNLSEIDCWQPQPDTFQRVPGLNKTPFWGFRNIIDWVECPQSGVFERIPNHNKW